MANEWIQSDGMACYDTTAPGFTLSQTGLMEVGNLYFFKISVIGMTQGFLNFPSILGASTITEDGDYTFIGKAIYADLIIYPGELGGGTFNGCIDNLELSEIPLYKIKDSEGNTVFELTDQTGITADRNYVQYVVDWSDMPEGEYYIEFSDGILTYRSDCFHVKLTHPCTLLIEYYNLQDGFQFDYSGLDFRPQLRLEGKLLNDRFVTEDKTVYDYSDGTKEITYARVYEESDIVIADIPYYLRQAVGIGMNHDVTYVNDVKVIFEDDGINPAHRKSSQLAPVTIPVKFIVNDLLNSNC